MTDQRAPNALIGFVAISLLVSGCAGTPAHYRNAIHPSYGQAEFDRDNYQCQRENQHQVVFAVGGMAQANDVVDDRMAAACLAALGWRKVQQQLQPQQPPPVTQPPAPSDGKWISKDGLLELKLSSEWKLNTTPTTATNLQLRVITADGTGLTLASRDRNDVAALKIYSEEYSRRIGEIFTDIQFWPPETVMIGDHPAIRIEFVGVFKGERAHCLTTVLQMESRIATITGCAPPSKFMTQRDKIILAATGLRETSR